MTQRLASTALVATMLLMGSCASKYTQTDRVISIPKTEGVLRLEVCSDTIIRVVFEPRGFKETRKSLIVDREWEQVEFDITTKDGFVNITTKELLVLVDLETDQIQFKNNQGEILLTENYRGLKPVTVMDERVHNVTQRWSLSKDEGIYGLGQHQDGYMNYRGKEVTLIQTNTVGVNPFLVSTKAYGILWDNYSKTIFSDDGDGAQFWSEVGDRIDYYFIAGDDMDGVIAGYREATGQSPMLGKWAFGYWQSKERYKDADELLGVVKEYRQREIPIDNIVQDWCYWADYKPDDKKATWESAKANWSSMYFDPSTYKDPAKTIKEIHDVYKMHYMISIWPALGPETEIYKEMKAGGYLYEPQHWSSGYLYDAFSKEARDIYWKHVKAGVISKGVDALWMDGTEPELGDQHTFDVSEKNIKSFGQTARGSMARNMNAYSLMTTTGAYENFRKDFPNKRFFTLTRSSFAGQQKNAAATWSGDINSRFDVLRDQISSGLNFCMAGIPYWTTDIGGFFIKGADKGRGPGLYPGGHEDSSYRELYVRWFQYGAFCPLFRSHGTHTPREVWRFGEPGDWAYDTLLKYDHLRYRLMPYIYSAAWRVTNEGYTMMRGLPMDFTSDKKTYNIDNQFMFGDSIMVCPVTEHQYYPIEGDPTPETKTTSLYLPAGTDWYDFWTGEKLLGGQQLTRETPIDVMPLYIKAGSIIPFGPQKQYATQKQEDPIELRIYPSADATFTLYEDENDNYNYEQGKYATIDFTWNDQTKTLTIDKRQGQFPGMLEQRTFNVILVKPGHGSGGETEQETDLSITYTGQKVQKQL